MNITLSKTVANHPKQNAWLQFVDLTSQQRLLAPQKAAFIIGRDDEDLAVDVDTTPIGGYRMGVSRQHLQIEVSPKGIYAKDTNSSYGSALNGQTMQSHTAYPLHDGDELMLGHLRLAVQIHRYPNV